MTRPRPMAPCGPRERNEPMEQFKPGDLCPKSGIYDVVHDGVHQDKHQVTMVKGETFPPCRHCGDHPRFTLAIAAHHAPNHEHFKK
jgi:hypothetical protein